MQSLLTAPVLSEMAGVKMEQVLPLVETQFVFS
jgi:hypothetical protein